MNSEKNIQNKKLIKKLLKNIAESSLQNIDENIRIAYHENATINAF